MFFKIRNSFFVLLLLFSFYVFLNRQKLFQRFDLEVVNRYLKWLGIISSIMCLILSSIFGELKDFLNKDSNEFTFELLMFFILFLLSINSFVLFSVKYIQAYSACTFNISLCSQVFWVYILSLIRNENSVSVFSLT